jgi:hypothetical protein
MNPMNHTPNPNESVTIKLVPLSLLIDHITNPKTGQVYSNPITYASGENGDLSDNNDNHTHGFAHNFPLLRIINNLAELYPEINEKCYPRIFNCEYLYWLASEYHKTKNPDTMNTIVKYIDLFEPSERVINTDENINNISQKFIDDLDWKRYPSFYGVYDCVINAKTTSLQLVSYKLLQMMKLETLARLFIDMGIKICNEYSITSSHDSKLIDWICLGSCEEVIEYAFANISDWHDHIDPLDLLRTLCLKRNISYVNKVIECLINSPNINFSKVPTSILEHFDYRCDYESSVEEIYNFIVRWNIDISQNRNGLIDEYIENWAFNSYELSKYICGVDGHLISHILNPRFLTLELYEIAYRASPVDSCIKLIPIDIMIKIRPFGSKTKAALSGLDLANTE